MSSAGRVVVTQLIVDASGAKQGVADFEVAMEKAKAASLDAGTATGTSFEKAQLRWQNSLAATDPILKAQIKMQQALASQQGINDQAVKLGIITQTAATAQMEKVRAKQQELVESAGKVKEGWLSLLGVEGLLERSMIRMGEMFAIGEILVFSKEIFEAAAALKDQAAQAGVSVEAFQAYKAVMAEAGMTGEQATNAMQKLTRNIGEAKDKAGTARDAFNTLGVTFSDLAGGTESAMPKVAEHLLNIQDASERARLEVALFGRAGQEMEGALRDLIDPTVDLIEKQKALGLVLGTDVAESAHKAEVELNQSWQRIKNSVTPYVVELTTDALALVEALAKLPASIPLLGPGGQSLRDEAARRAAASAAAMANTPQSVIDAQNNGFGMLGPVPGINAPPSAPANDNYKAAALDKYIDQQKLSASLAGLSAQRRAEEEATIQAANHALEDGVKPLRDSNNVLIKNVSSYEQARSIIGEATAKQVEGYAATIQQGKAAEKLKETYTQYVAKLNEEARVAGETATQREQELAVIKAAQVVQKENNPSIQATKLVQSYAAAAAILGTTRTLEVDRSVQAKVTAAYTLQTTNELTLANTALAAGRNDRDLAVQIKAKELELGRALSDVEVQRLKTIQQLTDSTGLSDYMEDLRQEVKLTGLSADERERELAVLQEIRATHGNLTAAQSDEIRGLISQRQELERQRGLVDGIAGSFQSFFQDVFQNGKASFGNLFNAIKGQFASLLAYMAAQALIQPIIVPMVEEFTGGGGLYSLLGGNPATGLSGGAGGGALGSLSTLGNLSSLTSLGGGNGLLGSLGGGISSAFNGLGSALGFASNVGAGTGSLVSLGSAAGAGGDLFSLGSISSATPGFAAEGSLFGATTLGGLLGGAGIGSLASSLIFGNKNSAGIGGMGGALAGAALGSIIPGIGTIIGGLVGGLAGGGLGSMTGTSNQGAIANFSDGGAGNYLFKAGGGNNGQLATQAASTISDAIKTLQGAGVTMSLGNITGLSIGSDKSYVYDSAGGKQKLAGGDVDAVVQAILTRILPSISGSTAEAQAVIAKYQAAGGINASNLSQLTTDLGAAKSFADALANLKSSGAQLSQIASTIKNINDQYASLVTQAQNLGLATDNLTQAHDLALQDITDTFNSGVTDAINGILDGPLQQWNALVKAQSSQMDDAKLAGADLANLEKLQGLQRKQLLMSLDESQRESLTNLIGLADDLAAKTVSLQATSLKAINSQIAAAQSFAQQQANLASQYGSASTGLNSSRVGFLVDPNANRLSATDAYAQSRQQLEAAASKGDLESLNSLGGLASSFLQNSLAVNATSTPYADDFQHVQDLLTAAKAKADEQQAATLTQSQLATQQVAVLTDISTELQTPDPNTALLQSMLDKLDAINGGITSNAGAIIAAFQADPTAAAIGTLGGLLLGSADAQTGRLAGALDVLRSAQVDGLVTVAAAGPTRDAVTALQNTIGGLLTHQSDLTGAQLLAAQAAQSALTQISSGVAVINLDQVAAPISALLDATNGLGAASTAAITGAISALQGAAVNGLLDVASAGPTRDTLLAVQTTLSGLLAHQGDLTKGQLEAAVSAQGALDRINAGILSGISVVNISTLADPLNALVSATSTQASAITGATRAQQDAITGALLTLQQATSDGLVTVAEANPVRDALTTLQGVVAGLLGDQAHLTQGQLQAALSAQALLDQIRGNLGTGLDVTNLNAVADPVKALLALTATVANATPTVIVNNSTSTTITNDVPTVTTSSSITGDTSTVGTGLSQDQIDNIVAQASNGDGDPAFRQNNSYYQLARSLGIPGFNAYASGTDYHPGGWALVGEEGPEFMRLPAGAQVRSASATRNDLASANDNSALLEEMQAMRREIVALRQVQQEGVRQTARGADAAEATGSGVDKLAKHTRDANTQGRFAVKA